MEKKIKFILLFILIWISLILPKNARAVLIDEMDIRCPSVKNIALYKGDVIRQTFTSTVESFGVVSVKFTNFNKINNDNLTFKIKEEGEGEWYYENNYNVDQFQNDSFFPFGFPPITDAINKTYIFEIQSNAGKEGDSIGVFVSSDDCRLNSQGYLNDNKLSGDVFFKLGLGVPAKEILIKDSVRIFSDSLFILFWYLLIIFILFIIFRNGKK